MSTRADNYTQLQKTPDLFSDFLYDLTPHPITADVISIKNDQAIKQSLRQLVLTKIGERFFQPTIGCEIDRALFEPNDVLALDSIQYYITNTITNNESRVTLLNVTAISDTENDRVVVNIVFSIINTTAIQSLNLFLKRAR